MARVIVETIRVDIDDIEIGVHPNSKSWWNWNSYIETWKIIDCDPNTPIEKLPLYKTMKKHYSSISDKRLRFELDLLGLKTGDRADVARGWVKRHVELYKKIKNEGFNEKKAKRIRVRRGRTTNGKVVLSDGHHRISMLKHLGKPRNIEVVVI